MICVSSVGIGRYASSMQVRRRAELAEKAYCPVANHAKSGPASVDINWIVVRDRTGCANRAEVRAGSEVQMVPYWHSAGDRRTQRFGRRIRTSRTGLAPSSRCAQSTDHHSQYCRISSRPTARWLAVIGSGEAGQLARLVRPSDIQCSSRQCSVLSFAR